MKLTDIIEAYANELQNWDFFSDPQTISLKNEHIVVCLRNYNWYITKEKIKDVMTAIKALFEIDWIASMDDDEEDCIKFIDSSTYWKKY